MHPVAKLAIAVWALWVASLASEAAPIMSSAHLVSPDAARDYTGIYDGGSAESTAYYNAHIESRSRMYYLRVAFTPSNATLGVTSTFHKESALVNQFRLLAKNSKGVLLTEHTLLTPHWEDFFKLDATRNTVLYLRVDIGHYPWPENGTLFLEYTALPEYVELGIKDRGDDTFMKSATIAVTVDNGPIVVQYVDPYVHDADNITYVMFNKPVKLNTRITTWNVTWADYCGIQSATKQWYLNRTTAPYPATGTADANGFSRFWLLPTHNETTTITSVVVNRFVCPQVFVDKNGVLSPNSNLIREWRGAEGAAGDASTEPQPLVYGAIARVPRGPSRPTRLLLGDLEASAYLIDKNRDGLYDQMDLIFTGRVIDTELTPAMFNFSAFIPASYTLIAGLFPTINTKTFPGGALEVNIKQYLAGIHTGTTTNDNVIHLYFNQFNDDLLYRYMDGGAMLMLVTTGLNLYFKNNVYADRRTVVYENVYDGYYHLFSPPITIVPIITAPETTYAYNLTAGYGYFTTTFAKPLDIFRRSSTEVPGKSTVGRNGMVDYSLQMKPTKQTPSYSSRNDPAVYLTTRSISHTAAINTTCFEGRFQSFRDDSANNLFPSKVVTTCRAASLTTPLDPRSLANTHASTHTGNLHAANVWWLYSGTSAYPWFAKRAVAIANFSTSTNHTMGMQGASSVTLTGSEYRTFPYDPLIRTYTPVSTLKRGNTTAPNPVSYTFTAHTQAGTNKTMYNYTVFSTTPIWKSSLNLTTNLTCQGCTLLDSYLVDSTAWGVTKFNVTIVLPDYTGDAHKFFLVDLSKSYDVNGFALNSYQETFDYKTGDGKPSTSAIVGYAFAAVGGLAFVIAVAYALSHCATKVKPARASTKYSAI